ncbi:hypothetical protein [Haloarcula laminariae]|uniref:hypothetical protein n=1 Tax=Haloarcula laminariae TaxID=2961577 RepID=UPI0021C5A8E7|nr:hypothetical protein [Halomicroarcula laminariae]
MSRKGLLLVAVLATAAVLVPTGAAPFDLTGTDDVSGDIELRPADGPNGNYAVLGEDDELELLLTGANPATEGEGISSNAATPIPRVFTMTYTGDQEAIVWLTDDAEDVRFYRGDDSSDSLEGEANSVTLGPSETVTVGLLVDTRGEHDVEQAETFSVNAEVAEDDDDDGYVPPTSTPTPTEEIETVRTPVGTPPTPDEAETPPPTPSEPSTESPTESSPPDTAGGDADGGPVELGGLGLGSLLGIGGGLAVLLSALVGYRLFA